MYLEKHLLPWGLDHCHSECGIIIYSGDSAHHVSSSLAESTQTWVCWLAHENCTTAEKCTVTAWEWSIYAHQRCNFALIFLFTHENYRRCRLRELSGRRGRKELDWEDTLVLIKRVDITQEKTGSIYFTS